MERREFVIRGIGAMAVGAGVAGGLLACGGDDDTGVGPGNGDENGNGGDPSDDAFEIDAVNYAFNPENPTIDVGTTVRWTNNSGEFHTVTPDGHSDWSDADLADGDTFEHTFDNTGEFDYYCRPHQNQGMVGTITVE